MSAETVIDVLNRLLVVHRRSLVMYLSYAPPEWHRGEASAREALLQIVADDQALIDRLGELIVDSNGAVAGSTFPMVFTGYHDLSFDFLHKRLIEHQRRDIAIIERCVQELSTVPFAKAIAEEALGAAKAHLESLLELEHPRPPALV